MTSKSKKSLPFLSLAACVALVAVFGLVVTAEAQTRKKATSQPTKQAPPQSDGEETERRFWPPGFRPAAAATPERSVRPAVRPRYRPTTPALPKDIIAPGKEEESSVGITIWVLNLAKDSRENEKEGARLLSPKTGNKTPFIPKRVEAGTKFQEGQKVRLSIEVPRSGYLYVLDREQYESGSNSAPYLIFPLDSADDNRVAKGKTIDIPSRGEHPYFEVKSLRAAGESPQTAELLTVLITPTPLKDLPKATRGDDGEYQPIELPEAQVAEWEKQWATQTEMAELEGGEGRVYTLAEQAAGYNRNKRLGQADPLPQTVIRVAPKPGKPLLVKLPLKIGK